VTELNEIICAEIRAAGAISFARFMELALYHPRHGYYERNLKQTGRQGDFFTSVSVGSLYGEFLGFEFARRFPRLSGDKWSLIEAGAHDGNLALDILNYLKEFQKETFCGIQYLIIEPSKARTEEQHRTLAPHRGKVRWVGSWDEVADFRGICFSNELLDAMPVHVFRWEAARRDWTEWGVAHAGEAFRWQPLSRENPNARRLLARLPEGLLNVLPDQFTVEICPGAVSWWLQAAHRLQEGWLFTADYGLLQDDFFAPHRSRGTLRSYSRHRVSANLLESVGEQDLTAHVNFSLLIAAGESAGLKTEEFVQQGIFLKTILEEIERRSGQFPLWTAMRYRQLTSLVHPEHLGRAFKVLVQGRTNQES
jgi:SAM-dependent MidA family methyltransferase